MKIAAVIVTYNRYAELKKTIFAILDQGLIESDIFIVDNNEGNERVSEFYDSFKTVNLLLPESNIASAGGFAWGMDAARLSGYNWVWLFNDDSRPVLGSLDSLTPYLKDPKIGLIKIANVNNEGNAILLYWRGVRKPKFVISSNDVIATDLVTFDGCMVSGELIDRIGTCDPGYFMGTYEFDYCLRAKDAGYSIFTISNGLIEDEKLGSVGGTPPWRQYYNTRNHLHLAIVRKDPQIVWAWIVREAKFTYSILRYQDQKLLRLKMKLVASWHAIVGKRGRVYHH
jgi:rhamnosyltransferase